MPALIYCADGNPKFAACAVANGWLYGAKLPSTVYERVYFADQDWKHPQRAPYMKSLETHRPHVATVIDIEHEEQISIALDWALEASQWVEKVILIPKVQVIESIPSRIGRAQVVLGYSVPTSYGGTNIPIWEFGSRPVHLLGGSPQRQMELANYLNVVSADGNMAHQQAHRCRFWSRLPWGPKSLRWVQLRDVGDTRIEGANLEAFRRSCVNIRDAWMSR